MIESIEQGRKEDGNRSIADKIIKRLHDLDKTVENNEGRWAWELLQNAKDSIADEEKRSVSVRIKLDDDKVEFSHNGIHFTEQDVRGLINQISSKEIEEGQQTKKTGRFGTGFLTTHLLSRIIDVKGIVETNDKKYYSFEFPLDRNGKTTQQLIPKIEDAWAKFQTSTKEINKDYDKDGFNTSFCYKLNTTEQLQIAKKGVEEFTKLIPFVLAFIPKIGMVEIIDNTLQKTTIFENSKEIIDGCILSISKTENKKASDILILFALNDKVSIATQIEKNQKGYSIKSIKDIPKLFCDFPLIGTENFHFPIIVNSFFFNPQTERDGIWLKGIDGDKEVEENKALLEKAVELFKSLLSIIIDEPFYDFFNFIETKTPNTNEKYFDEDWYREYVQTPLRESIIVSKIVELENSATDKKAISELWFPSKSYSQKVKDKLWQFTFDLSPNEVCKKEHVYSWCDVSWEDWKKLDYYELVNHLEEQGDIEKLSLFIGKNKNETYDWLNSVCKFLLEDSSNLSCFEDSAITPNQNGVFKKRTELNIDKINDADLVTVLELLGDDWKDILVNGNVYFGRYQVKEKKGYC